MVVEQSHFSGFFFFSTGEAVKIGDAGKLKMRQFFRVCCFQLILLLLLLLLILLLLFVFVLLSKIPEERRTFDGKQPIRSEVCTIVGFQNKERMDLIKSK